MHGLPGRRDEVDDVPEPALVLEGEVGGVVEVDVRLRRPVDQQRPGPRPLRVGHQLGEAAADGLDDCFGAATTAP